MWHHVWSLIRNRNKNWKGENIENFVDDDAYHRLSCDCCCRAGLRLLLETWFRMVSHDWQHICTISATQYHKKRLPNKNFLHFTKAHPKKHKVWVLFRGLSLYGVPAFANSIHANGRVSATCVGGDVAVTHLFLSNKSSLLIDIVRQRATG